MGALGGEPPAVDTRRVARLEQELRAERLFAQRGLGAVSLQDIAREVSMRRASLYYYAPRGKEQSYVEAMERSLRRHGEGLTMAIIAAGDDFRAHLHAIARWFATSSPLDLGRIVHAAQAVSDGRSPTPLRVSVSSVLHEC